MLFFESRESKFRIQLVDHYLAYAKTVAAVLYARRQGNEVEFEDYHQLARVGLLEAIDRFDPTRGLQFNTFAEQRIRGAILNGLENQTEKQRQLSTIKRLQADRLAASSAVVSDSINAHAKDKIFSVLAEVGIGLAISWMLADTGIAETAEDSAVEFPFYKSLEVKQLRDLLLQQLSLLSNSEQRVIRYHYLQGITMEEIAEIFSLTKGRISQIHKSALKNLRQNLKAHSFGDLIC
ncbi:sigma-70 family RNA polymerase sigma factor [Undibacterium flavidum]|uniref:Sigma-70 family RNA polymerase sigma factor n=1 Tax=Undibacterium flavidum TaxID=2762297 RepID=A0ABR6YER5_9BURK|nr:sigma-70 family RNA polymerase sigma factor [Undibacterium flavidum]MBC3875050.1 sigma-70 family RNA polymerase sigma factor [Undibacterium flavidum]